MTFGRIVSGLVALGYLVIAFSLGGPYAGTRVLVFLLLPLACIWFSEEMGEFTGNWGGHHIDEKSPGCMLAFLGWSLLLLPPLAVLATHLLTKR